VATPPKSSEVLRVSRNSVYGIILALIAMASAVLVSYINNRPNTVIDAPDRYTGTRGDKHEARTKELEARAKATEESIQQILATRTYVLSELAEIHSTENERHKEYDEHIDWSRKMAREFAVNDARTAVKLDECLQRAGLK